MWARISRPSTSRGLGRLKYPEPSTSHTRSVRAAGKSAHQGVPVTIGASFQVRSRSKPHGIRTATSGEAITISFASTRRDFSPARRGEGNRDGLARGDRKSTRLNSSHDQISYAVFCLKKKK